MNKKWIPHLVTGSLIFIAVVMCFVHYSDYLENPWTRDGQVRARVIQVSPRVSGPLVKFHVKDDQYVKKGTLLFEIDPRTFQVAVEQAEAALDTTRDTVKSLEANVQVAESNVEAVKTTIDQAKAQIAQYDATLQKNKAQYDRVLNLFAKDVSTQKDLDVARADFEVSVNQKISAESSLVQAKSNLLEAEANLAKAKADLGLPGEQNSQYRQVLANLKQAKLNLEFTKVYASVNGYVTNLTIKEGSQAVTNQPISALVDTDSYYIDAFFREDIVGDVAVGDQAVVTLMSYHNKPLEGTVESISWGIAQSDGSAGYELLPNVNPTFEWIGLAQRVPVKIKLKDNKELPLRVGTTASVLVKSNTQSDKVIASPKILE